MEPTPRTDEQQTERRAVGVPPRQRRMVAGGAIGTLMEYYDYYLYGLASATVFPTVFFPESTATVGTLESFATFAFGFLLRPIGGVLFGHVGDRMGRKKALMMTVVGMGIVTAAIGLIPSADSIGIAAPILLLFFRMLQGLFVGGEMGGAASLVIEHAPVGRRGLFGALLISGAGVANVASAGFMAALGIGSEQFFMTWGWRIPFLFALVLAVVAVVLRSRLEESEEFKEHANLKAAQAKQAEPGNQAKRELPLKEVFRHPKNALLGILIGLPQSIAGYVILTFGLAYMVSKGTQAQVGFIGTMIVGALQIFVAPLWGMLSDRIGRRRTYIGACVGFALLIYPTFALYQTDVAALIWLGMVVGFVIPGVAMQGTLQTMLAEMFDVEARTTGVNIGYQISNTLGGGFAPLIAAALTAAFDSVWPVVVYAAVIAVIGIVATAYASLRPDVENAPRLADRPSGA
ncbi:MFS transporter, MHS family, shikimate and dehydroshikimate transport protein [Actinopolymorpha cephalotaxi]|uniref:MFS transporter, MHS family, shikimate and dehydroshikimate transport protein n=1 Tax=Actinopolymorpha cephalotaxi TaxID=504797 RepID=A0A1I2ZYJ6_9ACTN|nr:MFS transporter [Actinopolymorpha cephalotaxi]NYH84236.1 MHS family shikimate/dehydroshikimate transporter-like MFS transporter [Actinopolymorpha cephalotaxi]SFH42735.1 MFS transporter, MHS family, shikimate and dehydroshikimate transport protein [Actinopolymorpha cephalotaxi]